MSGGSDGKRPHSDVPGVPAVERENKRAAASGPVKKIMDLAVQILQNAVSTPGQQGAPNNTSIGVAVEERAAAARAAAQQAEEDAAQLAAIAEVDAGNLPDSDPERVTTPVQCSQQDPERVAATVEAVAPTDGMNPHGGERVCIRGRWYPPRSPPR